MGNRVGAAGIPPASLYAESELESGHAVNGGVALRQRAPIFCLMNTRDFANVMATLGSELALGVPPGAKGSYMLNLGDAGLLASLDKLSAAQASSTHAGGASIAAHVDHLRYGVSLLNQGLAGAEAPWKHADWTASWKKNAVSEDEWHALRDELRRELTTWIDELRTPRDLDDRALGWVMGSIAHLGYHFGAIRQIDRDARGPTAEDEARIKASAG